MNDLHAPRHSAVMKALLEAGLMTATVRRLTGMTLGREPRGVESIFRKKQEVIHPLDKPLHKTAISGC